MWSTLSIDHGMKLTVLLLLIASAAFAVTIGTPAAPLPLNAGTGLNASFYSLSVFAPTVAENDAAIASLSPTATFRVLNPVFPPSGSAVGDGISVADFVGTNGTDFAGSTATQINRSYFVISGFLRVLTPGEINFELNSDDGSILSIDGTTVVNNDGNHSLNALTGVATFTVAGLYPVLLRYFENDGVSAMVLRADLAGGTAFSDIPTASLYTSIPNAAVPEPATFSLAGIVILALAFRKSRS
ncbi:MAG: PEP-CTERM sorting domain-containing protein [Bryobacteraceae bacterium]|nr:PEP-CTERM sorting domain-containing protein [Bryobacteraceae bacterium]